MYRLLLPALLTVTAALALTPAYGSVMYAEDRLVSDLIGSLSSFGAIAKPPGMNVSEPVQVKLGLTLNRLLSLKDNVARFDVWQTMEWTDPRLTWAPSEYENQTELVLPADLVWLPDIRPYNAEEYKPNKEFVRVTVGYKSVLKYVLPVTLSAYCLPANRSRHCSLKFGSWSYNGDQLSISLSDESGIDMSTFVADDRWKIVSSNAEVLIQVYDCCPYPFISVMYNFKLEPTGRRRYPE